jgi:hypothetical protein
MLPPTWTKLRYHADQRAYWTSKARFRAMACGRGSGKTEIARRYCVRMLAVRKPWNDPLYAYCLPTYPQARRVAWNKILGLVPKEWIRKISLQELEIETVFGSKLIVAGLDAAQRLEGVQYDEIWIDESSDVKPGVFDRSLLPALSHRKGKVTRLGVPKRYGVGAIEFKSFFDKGLPGPNKHPDFESWSWPSADIVSPEEIDAAMEILDIKDFQEQYEASWEKAGGLVYYAFNEEINVLDDIGLDPNRPILVGSDFNVSPMSWVLAQKRDGKIFVFDEIYVKDTNTTATLDLLWRKYGDSTRAGWEFYGDATGRQRKSSASLSDYLLIRGDQRFYPKEIKYPGSNPMRMDRYAAVNAALRNAKGNTRLYVSRRCKRLIKDLKNVAFAEGTREVDTSDLNLTHISDALGYMIYRIMPVRGIGAVTQNTVIAA